MSENDNSVIINQNPNISSKIMDYAEIIRKSQEFKNISSQNSKVSDKVEVNLLIDALKSNTKLENSFNLLETKLAEENNKLKDEYTQLKKDFIQLKRDLEKTKTTIEKNKKYELIRNISFFVLFIFLIFLFVLANLKIVDESISSINKIILIFRDDTYKDNSNKYLDLLNLLLLWVNPIIYYYFFSRLLKEIKAIWKISVRKELEKEEN